MIRHPNFSDRQDTHSPTYWHEELTNLRDLKAKVDEYGGIHRLRSDILKLEHELAVIDGQARWVRPVLLTSNEQEAK